MLRRVARGWVIQNGNGKVVGGPYYSLSYAEAREKELREHERRTARKQRRSCI